MSGRRLKCLKTEIVINKWVALFRFYNRTNQHNVNLNCVLHKSTYMYTDLYIHINICKVCKIGNYLKKKKRTTT